MEKLKKDKIRLIITSSILIILGLVFCFIPQKSVTIVEMIASICFIAGGIIDLIIYCYTSPMFRDTAFFMKALLLMMIGLLLSFLPSFFIFALGLIIALKGIDRIGFSIDLKSIRDKKWWIDLVAGIIVFILGTIVVILCNTKLAQNIVMIVFGIILILSGIIKLVLIFALHRKITKFKKIVEENEEDFTDYEIK